MSLAIHSLRFFDAAPKRTMRRVFARHCRRFLAPVPLNDNAAPWHPRGPECAA